MLLFRLVSTFAFLVVAKSDSFPSLITTNATLAVILDREFLADEHDSLKEAIETYLVYAKREILKHGGVNIQFFSWTSINVKRDITAILSVASCADTWKLYRAAEEENLLLMAISESDCPRLPPEKAVTIPLTTKGQEMAQLLLDLRTSNAYNWQSAVVIYDDTLSRDLTTRVIRSLTLDNLNIATKALAVSLMKLTSNVTAAQMQDLLRGVLSQLHVRTVGRNFMVIVSIDMVEDIMEVAHESGLVNVKNQWLYVISDTSFHTKDLNRFKKRLSQGDNIAFLYNTTVASKSCTEGVVCHAEELLESFSRSLDDAIQDEYELASQVSDEEWEAIRPSKEDRRNFLLKNVKHYLRQYGNCDNCTSWSLKTADTWGREFMKNSTEMDIIDVGNWRPMDGPSMVDELYPHIVHGFRGRILPLVTFHNPPWQILKLDDTGNVLEFRGLVFDIIKELSENLNFTYTVEIIKTSFVASTDVLNSSMQMGQIAEITTNFIPEAILEMMRNKTAAVGAGGFTITDEGRKHVNFTTPISIQTYTFLVARPRELSRALLFMSPFTKDAWLCLIASIISMGPILYYIHKFSPYYEYNGISTKGGLSSILNCIWYMYGALLQQGGMHLPRADSARIVVGAWWMVVLVVATTYCGNLVAFLTFPKIDIPITTIDELLSHRDHVTWSISKDSFLESQLKITNERKFQHLYDGKVDIAKSKKMIQDIEDGKHVFIDWKIRLQYIMKKQFLETDKCDLALGQDEFFDEQIALIVAPDTPYLEIINDEIKRLHQVGLIQKWLKDYLPKRDRCWKNRHIVEVNNHTVNMDDMQGSFFVLLLGFGFALFLIIGEKLVHLYLHRKNKTTAVKPFIS